MKDYQERVIIEKTELDEKIDKLTVFIDWGITFSSLDEEEKERLRLQLRLMMSYSEVLGKRILNFKQ